MGYLSEPIKAKPSTAAPEKPSLNTDALNEESSDNDSEEEEEVTLNNTDFTNSDKVVVIEPDMSASLHPLKKVSCTV